MPYIHVENFAGGLDDRKSVLTAAPGTLAYLNNAHLTAGGEIEKRKAFVPVFIFAPNIKCLGGWPGVEKSVLFGNGLRPQGLPAEFDWVDVRNGGVSATRLKRVVSWGAEWRALVEYPGQVRRIWRPAGVLDTTDTEVWDWEGLDPTQASDLFVMDEKLYVVIGSVLETSGVAEPDKHGPGVTGSAVYDASKYGPKALKLVAVGQYQNRLATLAKRGAVIWQVDPDPDLTRPLQFIDGLGVAAPRSVVEYGEADTFLLSYSGVRSIRARDSSNVATAGDVGSPINKTISRHLKLLLETDNVAHAVGCYEPEDGRYWLALYDVIYVLSFFPSAKVSAWSTYTPGFPVVDMWAQDNQMFVLSNDTLFSVGAYRGNSDSDYDRTVVEVELPFLSGGDPRAMKTFDAMDLACEGKWAVWAAFSPTEPGADEVTNIVRGPTYGEGDHGLSGESTHIKLRLRSDSDGYALLSDVSVHYEVN